uniref:Uncharacterized protein n=1 Tax=Oryza meridionalis TaxID=40149 RepID=A0A0E0CN44_9ORYZ
MSPPPPPPAPAPRAAAHRVLPCNRRRRRSRSRSTSRIGHRRPRRHGRPGFLLPPLPRAPMLLRRGAQLGRRAREREEALAWTPEGRGEAVVVRRPERKTKGVELSGRRRRARRRVGLNAAPRRSSACTPDGGGGGGGIPRRRPRQRASGPRSTGSTRGAPGPSDQAQQPRWANPTDEMRPLGQKTEALGWFYYFLCPTSHLLLHAKAWLRSPTFASQPQQFTSHKRSGIAER